jgi:hypothetical protein
MEPMKVLSLGWGVQSVTIAAMVALGELEPIDVALHADTTHESAGTYAIAQTLTPWLAERGVRVVTVISKQAQPIQMVTSQWTDIPAFTTDGISKGQLRRQCTGSWKIHELRRWLQANREKRPVEQWIGISLDEYQRMKDSDVKYITHRWPLIEKRMTRAACIKWLWHNGLPYIPKSACVFCPYHDTRAWHDMKASSNGDWHKAIEVDRAIRKVRPPYDLFLHPARIPLEEVDFSTAEERGQLSLWNEECSGICGV